MSKLLGCRSFLNEIAKRADFRGYGPSHANRSGRPGRSPAVVLTLSCFAPGDTNIFAEPAEQHNVALAIEQGSMIP